MIDITDLYPSRRTMPERQLWLAVILQAFVDMMLTSSTSVEKRRAEEFLTRRTKRLENICDLADINVNQVIQAARKGGINYKWLLIARKTARGVRRKSLGYWA